MDLKRCTRQLESKSRKPDVSHGCLGLDLALWVTSRLEIPLNFSMDIPIEEPEQHRHILHPMLT